MALKNIFWSSYLQEDTHTLSENPAYRLRSCRTCTVLFAPPIHHHVCVCAAWNQVLLWRSAVWRRLGDRPMAVNLWDGNKMGEELVLFAVCQFLNRYDDVSNVTLLAENISFPCQVYLTQVSCLVIKSPHDSFVNTKHIKAYYIICHSAICGRQWKADGKTTSSRSFRSPSNWCTWQKKKKDVSYL